MRHSYSTRLALALLAIAASACGHTMSPTAPSTSPSATPQISSVTPGNPMQNDAPQLITVTGRNFSSGLLFFVTLPDQSQMTLAGTDIQAPQPTSFEAVVPLQQVGVYALAVKTTDGSTSPVFTFNVAINPSRTAPVISELNPAVVQHGAQAQSVTIGGVNLTGALSVSVTSPDNSVATISGSALYSISSTSLQASFVMAQPGSYGLTVVNGTGRASNSVAIAVK